MQAKDSACKGGEAGEKVVFRETAAKYAGPEQTLCEEKDEKRRQGSEPGEQHVRWREREHALGEHAWSGLQPGQGQDSTRETGPGKPEGQGGKDGRRGPV